MNIKSYITVVALTLIAFTSTAKAEEKNSHFEEPDTFLKSMVVTSHMYGSYYFDDAIFADVDVWWFTYTFNFKDGFWLEFFSSQGVFEEAGFDDEIDATLGWTGKMGPFGAQLAFLYVDAEPLFDQYSDDFLIFRSKIRHDVELRENINLWGRWTYRHVFQGTAEGGHLGDVGIDFTIPISDTTKFKITPQLLYNDGHFGVDPGLSCIADFGIHHEVNHQTTLFLGGRFFTPLVGREDSQTEWIYGFGATMIFK